MLNLVPEVFVFPETCQKAASYCLFKALLISGSMNELNLGPVSLAIGG